MYRPVVKAYQQLTDARPLVRPTYNQLEITVLPPYGDPEVHIPSEVGTYVAAALLINSIAELIYKD